MRAEGWGDRLSLTISAKPDGVGAASQRLIPTGERSGLLTHIAATGKRFVVHADEKLTAAVGRRGFVPLYPAGPAVSRANFSSGER
jgi:hypothetical protein